MTSNLKDLSNRELPPVVQDIERQYHSAEVVGANWGCFAMPLIDAPASYKRVNELYRARQGRDEPPGGWVR